MTDTNVQYKAPKWAIQLWDNYKYFERESRGENSYGIFHAGRMALESQFGCSFAESTGFFRSEIEPIESSGGGSFGIVESKPEWTHAVFNGDYEPAYLTSGELYLIKDWSYSGKGFTITDNKGDCRYCLISCCAHLKGGDWTLVNM